MPALVSSRPVLQLLKCFWGCFQLQLWAYCTLLCRLFLSGFPGSELGMLWHSRSFEPAISQATWRREIALNSFNPLKRWGPTKHLRAGPLICGVPPHHQSPGWGDVHTSTGPRRWFQISVFVLMHASLELRSVFWSADTPRGKCWLKAHRSRESSSHSLLFMKCFVFPWS